VRSTNVIAVRNSNNGAQAVHLLRLDWPTDHPFAGKPAWVGIARQSDRPDRWPFGLPADCRCSVVLSDVSRDAALAARHGLAKAWAATLFQRPQGGGVGHAVAVAGPEGRTVFASLKEAARALGRGEATLRRSVRDGYRCAGCIVEAVPVAPGDCNEGVGHAESDVSNGSDVRAQNNVSTARERIGDA
jgi:hypothetical protein